MLTQKRLLDGAYNLACVPKDHWKRCGWHYGRLTEGKERIPTSPTQLIHHSDRGVQYCCREYIALLEKHRVQISMARESYENPIAERVNGILKEELLRPGYPDHASAKMAIAKAIRIYNEKRPHRSLNMMMPEQAHQMNGPIPKRWKKNKYREQARKRRQTEHQSQKNTAGEKKNMTTILV